MPKKLKISSWEEFVENLDKVFTIEDYKKLLDEHDWYYESTADHHSWKKGDANMKMAEEMYSSFSEEDKKEALRLYHKQYKTFFPKKSREFKLSDFTGR